MKTNEFIRYAVGARVPLVWVTAPDTLDVVGEVALALAEANGASVVWRWDPVTGWDRGRQDPPSLNHVEALVELEQAVVASQSARILAVAHRLGQGVGEDPAFCAALLRCRKALCRAQGILVCVMPEGQYPPASVAHDFLMHAVGRPGVDELMARVRSTVSAYWQAVQKSKGSAPPFESERLVAALEPRVAGLTRFGAEQVAAVAAVASVDRGQPDLEVADRAREQILAAVGLQTVRAEPMALPGLEGLTDWLAQFRAAVSVVAWIDEIEKALAGARGDLTGVTQDQLGVLLQTMQEHRMLGLLMVGPPGTGKSELAKQAGLSIGVPVVQVDLGSMKGSLVGQSEQKIRSAMSALSAMSAGDRRVLIVATSNAIDIVPPELRRRFTLGTWFVDLPDRDVRLAIWRLWMTRCGLSDADADRMADMSEAWAPSDIAACCQLAKLTGCAVDVCAARITPTGVVAAELRQRLQKAAEGRWLDARTARLYRRPTLPGVGQDMPDRMLDRDAIQ